MSLRIKLLGLLTDQSTKVGYAGTALYWLFENQDALFGALLSLCMVISSIAYQTVRIISIRNDELRKQEKHKQELLQDQERHEQNIKDHNHEQKN
jgi:hypothetical protein